MTSKSYSSILRAIGSTAWAIQSDRLDAILDIIQYHAEHGAAPPGFRRAEQRQALTVTAGAGPKAGQRIAVLPIYGVISQRMNLMTEMSGGTSTELLTAQFDAALDDPNVGTVVFDVDSPGGSVNGVPELAARILAARGKGKRLVAVANTLMASAAYWLASACDEVIASPSAEVGSIGVFGVHTDVSEADAKEGVKRTIIKAGRYKAEGNPFEPLSTEARDFLQGVVDAAYSDFVEAVAKGRNVSAQAVRGGYGQGRALPARAARASKLVDRVATLDDVLQQLGAPKGAALPRSRNAARPQAHAPKRVPLAAAGVPAATGTAGPGIQVFAGPLPAALRFSAPRAGSPLDPTGDPDYQAPEECPECGGAMDENGICSMCGYVDPDGPSAPDDDDERDPGDRIDQGSTHSAPSGAPAAGSTSLPAPEAPKAEEEHVPEASTAPAGATPTVDRASAFLALARDHNRSIDDVQKWMAGGLTIDAVKDELLASHRNGARPLGGSSIVMGADREADRLFTRLGEQLVSIIQAGKPGGRFDRRLAALNHRAAADGAMTLMAGTPSGMSEGVGSDGGFFIQPDLLQTIIDPIYLTDPILSRVFRIPIGSSTNGVKYPVVDETSRATGSRWGGISMTWNSEADAPAASKPKMRLMELSLKNLDGAAYLTEDLTLDAPAAEALLVRAFAAETQFMLTAAVFAGTGGGQPLGIKNAGCTVSIAIEVSETKANQSQYLALNIPKMQAAMPAGLWPDMIWLYNQELLPYLLNASVAGSTAGAAVPVFVAMGGFANRPFDMILGHPAYASEFCEAPGTPGDIWCLAPSQYHIGEKGGAQSAWSMHVRFLNFENTLRTRQRIDGAPVWRTTVTPYKGAQARSPFINLATRS